MEGRRDLDDSPADVVGDRLADSVEDVDDDGPTVELFGRRLGVGREAYVGSDKLFSIRQEMDVPCEARAAWRILDLTVSASLCLAQTIANGVRPCPKMIPGPAMVKVWKTSVRSLVVTKGAVADVRGTGEASDRS